MGGVLKGGTLAEKRQLARIALNDGGVAAGANGQQPGRISGGSACGGIQQVDGGGLEYAPEDAVANGEGIRQGLEGHEEAPLPFRHGAEFEIDNRDGRECPEGADHELGHVEAGHVLYDHAAGTDELAFEGGEL